ncbi:flagellar hook-associated protein FlgL [Alicyclobacillus fodiniaquatilis]|uniref:Flagellar hook-associated protein FlgL n=1 Tax=Alicyclobacillus fodiniaquatilis TaxID=1661150 RepID=A0ABW4JQT4_9BACL
MRITQSMMTQNLLNNLNTIQQNLSSTENEMTSGKVLNEPSDNPIAMSEDIQTTTSIDQANAYQSTIQSGLSWMNSTTSVLSSMSSTLQSIQSVVLQSMNTTNGTPSVQSGLQQSIAQLTNNLYQLADTQQGGSYLFGGFASQTPVSSYISTQQLDTNLTGSSTTSPLIASGGQIAIVGGEGSTQVSINSGASMEEVESAINGATNSTGVTANIVNTNGTYQLTLQSNQSNTAFGLAGNNVTLAAGGSFSVSNSPTNLPPSGAGSDVTYAVSSSINETVNVTGQQLFNQLPPGGTQTLQQTLQSVINDVGNPSALQQDLTNLTANIGQVTQANADLGSRINQLNTLSSQNSNFISAMQTQQASLEDANMAQVETQYESEMSSYQASLQMGSQMILPTLAQYLTSS